MLRVMAVPMDTQTLLLAMSVDLYDSYVQINRDHPLSQEQLILISNWVARMLLRKGWRPSGETLPECPYGVFTCFDPDLDHEHP